MRPLKKIQHTIVKNKTLLIVLLVIFLTITGTFVFVVNQMSPKEIRSMILENIQKMLPAAHVDMGDVDLSVGISLKLKLEKLNIHLKKDNSPLFSIDDISIRIPIQSVLLGRGVVESSLDKPTIYYKERGNSNNWMMAMKKTSPTEKKTSEKHIEQKSSKQMGVMMIPGFMKNLKLNLNFTDVDLNYDLKKKRKGKIIISRFLIKNVNFHEKTAFEMASKMNFDLDDKKSISFSALAIGEFNLEDIYKKNTFNGQIIVNLNHMKSKGIPMDIPDIKTTIQMTVDKKTGITSHIGLDFAERNKISAVLNLGRDKIRVRDFSTDIHLKDILRMSKKKLPLVPGNAKLKSVGSLSVKNFKVTPRLKFSLTPGIVVPIGGLSMKTTIEGHFQGSNLKMDIENNLGGGSLNLLLKGKASIGKQFKWIKPLSITANANNISLDKIFPNNLLEKNNTKSVQAKKRTPDKTPPLIPSKINLKWKKIKIKDNIFSGNARFVISKNKIVSKKISIHPPKGSISLSFTSGFTKKKSTHDFHMKLNKLELPHVRAFLPLPLLKTKGTVNGKVEGKVSLSNNKMKYNVQTSIGAKNGSASGMNLKDKLGRLVRKLEDIPGLKGKMKKVELKKLNAFKEIKLDGNFSERQWKIDKFRYLEKTIDLNGRGIVYPPPVKRQGEMNMDLIVKNISSVIRKETGLKSIPVRLKGINFSLTPDYGHTVEKLIAAMAKKKTKETIQNKGKELLKKNKDKLKNLFKLL